MRIRKINHIGILLFIVGLLTIHGASRGQVNTDQVVRVGLNALYFEDYMLSIQYFNRAIESKPYLAKPYFYRAIAKLNLEDYNGAEADASEALIRNPFLADAYEVRGVARQNRGDHKGAIEDYDHALDQIPGSRGIMFNKSLALSEVGENDSARAVLDQLIEVHPGFDAAYTGRAKVELELGDTIAALDDLNKAIELNKNSANAFVMRAGIYMTSNKDYESALSDMNEAIKLQPRFAGYFVNRAFLRYNLNDYFGAMADYDYAITLDPLSSVAYFNRGLLRAEVSDNDRAAEDFSKVLELDPDDVRAKYNRGRILREKHDYKGALADLDAVIATYPDVSGLVFERFELLDLMGDRRGAMREYDRAMAMSRSERARFEEMKSEAASGTEEMTGNSGAKGENIGNGDGDSMREQESRLLAGRFAALLTTENEMTDEREYNNKSIRGKVQDRNVNVEIEGDFAVAYYTSPTELAPSTYYMPEADKINETRQLRMVLRVTNSEPQLDNETAISNHFKSIDYYTSLLSSGKQRSIDFFGRGMEQMTLHNYEAAIGDFSKAAELTPDFALAYFMRAVARHRQASPAMRADEKAEVDPSLLAAGRERERRAEILNDYERVIKLSPRSPFAYFNLGNLYLESGDLTSALSSYSRAIELKPDFGEAYYNRGYVYFKLGNREKGTADLSHAGELGIIPSYNLLKRMSQ